MGVLAYVEWYFSGKGRLDLHDNLTISKLDRIAIIADYYSEELLGRNRWI